MVAHTRVSLTAVLTGDLVKSCIFECPFYTPSLTPSHYVLSLWLAVKEHEYITCGIIGAGFLWPDALPVANQY